MHPRGSSPRQHAKRRCSRAVGAKGCPNATRARGVSHHRLAAGGNPERDAEQPLTAKRAASAHASAQADAPHDRQPCRSTRGASAGRQRAVHSAPLESARQRVIALRAQAGKQLGDVSHMAKAHNTRSCAGGGSAHAGAHSKTSAVRPQNPPFGTCAAQCVHARLAAAHLAYSLSRVCCTCTSVQEVQSAPGQQPGRAGSCYIAHTHALRGAASRQSALSTRKMSPRAASMPVVTPRGRGAAGAGAAAARSVRRQGGTSVLRVRSAPGRWRRRNTSAQVQTARGVGWARRRGAGEIGRAHV